MPRLIAAAVVAGALLAPASALRAQTDAAPANPTRGASEPTLGLAAIGAFTVHAGMARVQRGFSAGSIGATADFGYLRSRRVRVLADLTYLLTAPRTERVESEGRTYRDAFRDLSGHVAFAFHANDPHGRVSPYLMTGAGVDILSSSFGSLTLDTRYNANNFSLLAAAGTRVRLGGEGKRALQLEVRGVQAHNVRRLSVQVGVAALFNDLVRR